MAQGNDIQISSDTANHQRVQNASHYKGSKVQKSPTFQQVLQSDGSKWSQISAQIFKKNHDQEGDANRHNKKSVLAKVKEKAKKLRLSLRRKKHSEKNEPQFPVTHSSGVGPKDKGEEDAEYHSARMYESKRTPATNTQSLASSSGKHLEKLNTKQSKDEHASFSNTTDPHFKIHPPSDPSAATATTASVTDTETDTKNQTTTIDVPKIQELLERNSRFAGLKVSTPDNNQNKSFTETPLFDESQTPDKGVSVKEYLMHKLEPGEDERALSEIITQAISPRRDKMREAMSSFLKNDDQSSEENSSNVDNNVNLNFKSKSLPSASTSLNTNTTSIKQSHSLGSNTSKASMNLNQTFKHTFASYQDHFLSSSSKHNTKSNENQSLNRLNSPISHGSGANETQKSLVPSHTPSSVRRVPMSRAKQTQVPSHTETNTIQARSSPGTDSNATQTALTTGD